MLKPLQYHLHRKKDFTQDTYRKIKTRNTQSSHSKTDWLNLIAEALEFDPKLYHKCFTPEFKKYMTDTLYYTSSLEILYELLYVNERNAIISLTTSLLELANTEDLTKEELEYLEDFKYAEYNRLNGIDLNTL